MSLSAEIEFYIKLNEFLVLSNLMRESHIKK